MGKIETAIAVLQMTFLLFIVVSLVAFLGGGDLLSALSDAPISSEIDNVSSKADQLDKVSKNTNIIQENGTLVGFENQTVTVKYDNSSSFGVVRTGLYGVGFLSEGTMSRFNVSERECFSEVSSEFDRYKSNVSGTTVRVLPLEGFNGSISTSRILLVGGQQKFLGLDMLERGFAKLDASEKVSASARDKFAEAQVSAQENERGVWRCVSEEDEPSA